MTTFTPSLMNYRSGKGPPSFINNSVLTLHSSSHHPPPPSPNIAFCSTTTNKLATATTIWRMRGWVVDGAHPGKTNYGASPRRPTTVPPPQGGQLLLSSLDSLDVFVSPPLVSMAPTLARSVSFGDMESGEQKIS